MWGHGMRDSERVEFEWVFRSAYASVLRTVFLILHDRGRAEEVTQDAFTRLCERWHGVVRIDHPEAWVRQVAIRAAIRQAQRSRVLFFVAAPDETGTWDRLPDVDLAHSIAALPPRQRAAVALFYLDDRPVDEVALLLGVSTSTVKQHLLRARVRLAELLSEQRTEAPRDVS
jgi:RNA polymerase sigma factor (sigma-70 family)